MFYLQVLHKSFLLRKEFECGVKVGVGSRVEKWEAERLTVSASIPKAVSSEELAIGSEKRPCTVFVFCLFVKVCAIVLLLCKY